MRSKKIFTNEHKRRKEFDRKIITNKMVSLLLVIVLVLGFTPTQTILTVSAKKPKTKSHAYVVMDANSGETIYTSKPNKKIYPASTVKIMTAIVALDHMKTTKKIKFGKKMRRYVMTSDIAHLGLKNGSTYTVNNYLHMLLLCSDADSAAALAVGCSGSVKAFAKEMNKKAKELGMQHTSFDNPIGLDKGNGYKKTYTTAADFAKLARYAMSYSTIRSIVAKKKYKVPKAKGRASFTVYNTNGFYRYISYDQKKYQVIGLKTGTTTAAGHVLITVAKDKDGHEIICAFFGKSSAFQMYEDIKNLMDYTFAEQRKGRLVLSKGCWDCRFRESEQLVRQYVDDGMLTGSRFYPDDLVEGTDVTAWVNTIFADVKSESIVLNPMIQDKNKPVTWNADSLDSVNGKDVAEWFSEQFPECNLQESGVIISEELLDQNHFYTREEILLFLERVKQWMMTSNDISN